MTKKLSKDEINEKLKPRQITMIGDYKNNRTKIEFLCGHGHVFTTRPSQLMGSTPSGCPFCAGLAKLDNDEVDRRLMNDGRGFVRIGEYVNNTTSILIRCPVGHEVLTSISGIVNRGRGCMKCHYQGISLSKEIINSRLSASGSDIVMIGEFTNVMTKTLFRHNKCGNEWETKPNSILDGHGCPSCAERGGYKRNKTGWIYILKYATFIKYGITNNPKKRLRQHKQAGDYEVVVLNRYNDGNIPWTWEINIKSIFGGRFISQDIMPNGWTETLAPEKQQRLVETLE